jgi:hypothetical protein
MEGPAPSPSGNGGGKARERPALPAAAEEGFSRRLLSALLLMAMGFGAGWGTAALTFPRAQAQKENDGRETRGELLAAGWSEADQGIFTRRCQGNCRMPRLYGGGVVDVMEVSCLERPCGEIRAVFDVLDGQGQLVHQLPLVRTGRQGERLQMVLESERPEARRFVLREFRARARVD